MTVVSFTTKACPDSSAAPQISVIIPAWYGLRTIADCLNSVHRAAEDWRVEVLVVESSDDGSRELIREQFPDVRLILPPGRLQVGAARNAGLTHARAAVVCFVDQDCTVPEDWFDRLVPLFEETTVAAAGGSIGVRNPRNLSGMGVYFLEFFRHVPESGPARNCDEFLLGCNLAVRRSLFPAVQFPAQTLGEDVLYCAALRRSGLRLLYLPRVTVLHWNRSGWGEFFRYNRCMGIAAADYHRRLQTPVIRPILKFPILVLLTPPVNCLHILWRLLRARSAMLPMFLLLSPMCLLGNCWWAFAFFRRLQQTPVQGSQYEI
jgi:GT2 family glycosyltransferase